jgi:hypothetical protein
MLKDRGEGTVIEDIQAEKLQGLADKFQKFVQSEGSMDGAVFDE